MNTDYANKLLRDSQAGYEKIASDFSHTRGWFWPELGFIWNLIPKKARLLDIGCGNGRLLTMPESNEVDYVGIDFSRGLIDIARSRYADRPHTEFLEGNALALPFLDKTFDTVVSFAVFHHIPSRPYRIQFLREAARVAKPGALIVITAWNVWNVRPTTIIKFALKKFFSPVRFDFGDVLLNFNNEKNARYVHALTMSEIHSLTMEAGLTVERLEKIRRPSGEENFFILLRKITKAN
jgi:SAM-dependent methyltransferase